MIAFPPTLLNILFYTRQQQGLHFFLKLTKKLHFKTYLVISHQSNVGIERRSGHLYLALSLASDHANLKDTKHLLLFILF